MSYSYQVEIGWVGGRNGRLSSEGLPDMNVSSPPEFAGTAGQWTPEHLLAASAASCLMATFAAIAEFSGLKFEALRVKSAATLDKVPGAGLQFTEIVLAPEIAVASADHERAARVLVKAEKSCFVSQALRVPVRVVPVWTAASARTA
jgi:peroxiredoxin-like protein